MEMNELQRRSAFEDCLKQNDKLITKICFMYASDRDNYNDLRQEVLINVWQNIDRFENKSKLSTWLYRVCLNTCITFTNKERKHSNHAELSECITPNDDSSEHTRQLEEMYRMIDRLDRLEKAIILLWLDEMPYDDIASIMGMPRNSVASKLHRVKNKLMNMSNQ